MDELRSVCQMAAASLGAGTFSFPAGDCAVPPRSIGPIVLIVNEAVSNAIRHAHPNRAAVKITVGCRRDTDGTFSIEIADDGAGLPDHFDPEAEGGRGIHLMRQCSEQIGAKLAFHSLRPGLRVQLRLPRDGTSPAADNGQIALDHTGAERLLQDLMSGRRADGVLGDDGHWRQIFQALPAAIYTTDAAGRITYYNDAAANLWGCRPELGKSEFCGSWKLYWADGTPLPHEECPMAIALRDKKPIRGMEAVAERPDGTRVPFIPYPTPLFGSSGVLIGAVNMLVDISERKQAEQTVAKHRDEQSALYRFTDKLYRASPLSDVFDAALVAIRQALGCKRAAILLFDDTGVMRFVAWSELSETYRRAVEGHSPWAPGAKHAEPICIDNVEASDISDSLKETIKAERISALAFIPLVVGGELVGKFMTYYETPHQFTESEIGLSLTIARQLGFNMEMAQADKVRSRAEQVSVLLASIIETSEDAIVSKNLQGIVTSWNRGAERVFGYKAEEMVGRSIMLLIPPDRHSEEREIIDRLRRGERVEHYETVRRRKDGNDVHISLAVSPVKDQSGAIVGASKIARDISEQKRFEAQKDLLLNEIKHRVKNTLATVQAMASQSLRSASKDELRSFASRLHALGNAYDLLTSDNWDRAMMRDIVSRAIEPFQGARFVVHGPAVLLNASQALKLTMVLHELATNAVKYGALANATGHVAIAWQHTMGTDLQLSWKEVGGPPVSPPRRKGFGSLLIEQSGENVVFGYAPTGLTCTLHLAL
ncbi:MAG: PAS domain S-box protein [Hyphomicrobiaceae bacterium]